MKRNGRTIVRAADPDLLPDVDGRELVFLPCTVCGRPVRHTASIHGYARSRTRHEGCVLYMRASNYLPRGNDQDDPPAVIERTIAAAAAELRAARKAGR
jgi:hypothetical protein